jgi:hypothetical protein
MATTQTSTVLVTGNTYPVKDALRDLGGRWDATAKGWRVPAAKAAQAQALVSGAPRQAYTPRPTSAAPRTRGTWTGCRCGSVEEYSKPSDCWTCKHDA